MADTPNTIPARLAHLADQRSDSTLLRPDKDDDPMKIVDRMWSLMGLLYKPHPWHGVSIGKHAPETVTAYIEIVPTDTVKYEVDKRTGYLKVDRPNKFSSVYPANYGFLPQSYAGKRVAALCKEATGLDVDGDHDPLDIFVISEKSIGHGNIIVDAVPIGGIRMIDDGEADDKIIAVLKGDAVYGHWTDVEEMPSSVTDAIVHFLSTYKQAPGVSETKVTIAEVYGREEAHKVILASVHDYDEKYANLRDLLTQTIFQAVLSSGATLSDDESI
ncbi:inorganic pyrophosphatase [Thecamonas trahens ATCC 50062]|uniref:inorganic diphosphatase n=1 Tax=Thecamonas trahens ATCC 50062 TaxID=461836 RepID=A0A0L0D4I3_THETB|nr:inorganic pyrophosphatase [Thecamonas trahens ATCC 50062]KNC47224.1 inorganic pyrophosphatase [Thecamonas trahens ATCC 50062]|eukprot:XP_013759993.1 inorganic pyrophosphatase [Thecamonas trahens ATCC 50062]